MMGNAGNGRRGDLREFLGRRGVLPLLGGLAVVLVLGIFVVAVSSGGGGGDSRPSARAPTQAPDASGGLKTEASATVEATINLNAPTVVNTPDARVPTPGGAGDRLRVTKFGIDAPLSSKTVAADGVMPNPNGPDDVAFYNFPSHPGLGGAPGGGGNVVLSGHVDSGRVACKNGTVPPPCQAVFWDINGLRSGDEIELFVSGQSYRYRITANQAVSAATADWNRIVSATAQETITLITCSGNFNRDTLEYNSRQVVTGVRI